MLPFLLLSVQDVNTVGYPDTTRAISFLAFVASVNFFFAQARSDVNTKGSSLRSRHSCML